MQDPLPLDDLGWNATQVLRTECFFISGVSIKNLREFVGHCFCQSVDIDPRFGRRCVSCSIYSKRDEGGGRIKKKKVKKENQEKKKKDGNNIPPTPTGQHTNNNVKASVPVLIICIFMLLGAHLDLELLSYLLRCWVLPVAFKNERQTTLVEQLWFYSPSYSLPLCRRSILRTPAFAIQTSFSWQLKSNQWAQDVQLLQKLLHLQLLQSARQPYPANISGWEQRKSMLS